MKNALPLLAFALLFFACTNTSKFYSFDETQQMIDKKFQDSLFAHAHWGVLIESINDGEDKDS